MRNGVIVELPDSKPEQGAYEVYQRHIEKINQMQEEDVPEIHIYDHLAKITVYILVAATFVLIALGLWK